MTSNNQKIAINQQNTPTPTTQTVTGQIRPSSNTQPVNQQKPPATTQTITGQIKPPSNTSLIVGQTSQTVTAPSQTSTIQNTQTFNIENQKYRFPSNDTLCNAFRLGIVEDKPILPDYWTDSFDRKAFIGVTETKKKKLVKSSEEFTSYIKNIYKKNEEYIIITENSIYIVPADIQTKRIKDDEDDDE